VGEPLMYCGRPKTARTCTPRPILARPRIEVSASKTGAHRTRARVLATGVTLPKRG
jgi:hypothetical protein